MDPKQTLADAEICLTHDREQCAELLEAYFAWRMKYGFPIVGGDAKAFDILRRLGRVADTLAEALNQPTP